MEVTYEFSSELLFLPMMSRLVGEWVVGKACPGCISENMLILGRDIGRVL